MTRRKSKFETGAFYKVIWKDIITSAGWIAMDGEKHEPAECMSYGWITDANANSIRLSATMGDNKDGSVAEYNQHISIPTGCIVSAAKIAAP